MKTIGLAAILLGGLSATLVGVLFVMVYAYKVHWAIAPAFLLTVPLLALLSSVLSKRIKVIQKVIVAETTALAGATTESLRNIELVKSLGLAKQEELRAMALCCDALIRNAERHAEHRPLAGGDGLRDIDGQRGLAGVAADGTARGEGAGAKDDDALQELHLPFGPDPADAVSNDAGQVSGFRRHVGPDLVDLGAPGDKEVPAVSAEEMGRRRAGIARAVDAPVHAKLVVACGAEFTPSA